MSKFAKFSLFGVLFVRILSLAASFAPVKAAEGTFNIYVKHDINGRSLGLDKQLPVDVYVNGGKALPSSSVTASRTASVSSLAELAFRRASIADAEGLTRLMGQPEVLRNTLRKFYGLDEKALERCVETSGIDLGRRPETLSAAEIARLLHALPGPCASLGAADRAGSAAGSGSPKRGSRRRGSTDAQR